MVYGVQHLRRRRFIARQAAQNAADQRRVQRRRSAFAAYVAHNDAGAGKRVIKKVVKVAADGMRRIEAGRNLSPSHTGSDGRQQMVLHLARHGEVALHALFFTGDALIERGIFNGDGYLRRQRAHGAQMIVSKVAPAGMLQVEHADDFILVYKRHAKLGARFRIGLDIAWIAGHIRSEHRFFALCRGAHQSAPDGNVVLDLDVLLKTDREAVYQLLLAGVEQQDGEHMVVDDFQQKVADAFEQLVNIEDGGEVAADFVQQRQRAGLLDDPRVQPRILNAHCDTRGNEREQTRMFVLEVSPLAGFQIDHANNAVLVDQRHGQLRAHAGNGLNILGRLGDVIHQDGAALLHSAAGNAFAHFHPDTLGNLRQMADLKAKTQLLRAFVQQQDGENLIVDDAFYHLSHALHERVEIKRGVEHVRHFNEKRLNIHVWRWCSGSHKVH